MTTTLSALQNGSSQLTFVVAIDGYGHLLSNESQSAVQAAWASTDWASATVIRGITIDIDNHQELDPWNPFKGGGRITFRVMPDASDTFGVDVARSDAGAESMLTDTVTRTSTIVVNYADGFPATGEACLGTETFSYGFKSAGGLQGPLGTHPASVRGKYVAFGVKDSVSTYGAVRFSEYHRVANQDNGVPFRPIVSQYPRTWKGRRVSVWMHTRDPVTGALNSKSDALCVFLGELSEPRDDEDGWTSVLCESLLDRIPKAMLLRDQWSARVDYGVQLKTGQKFKFQDFNGTATRTANDLVVVASGASGTNQVNAGFYGHEEIASILNSWLGGETGASRIYGWYMLTSPEDVNNSPRSVWHFFMAGATTTQMWFKITWPNSTWAIPMGFGGGGTFYLNMDTCGAGHTAVSPYEVKPFEFAFPDTNGTIQIRFESQVGIFQNQRATLPGTARTILASSTIAGDAARSYGLFLLEGETPQILLGTIIGNYLRYARVLSTSLTSNLSGFSQLLQGKSSIGKPPPTLRQIFVHEGPVKTVLKWLMYSTGTAGYNHSTYDVLPYGQGVGLPYDSLGTGFELSCDHLPNANDTITVIMEKPRTLADVIKTDLVMRNAHLVFRNGAFRWVSWQTPSSAMATVVLDETNKAEPADNRVTHRSTSVLDASWQKNFVKINYNRDLGKAIGAGEDAFNAAPLILEDATSIDDAGGYASPVTLDLKNTYDDSEQVGQGVRALAANMLTWMSHWSRPLWRMRRSIAPTLFEGFGVGDVVLVTDPHARDPVTGQRGVTDRPGLVVGHRYKIITAQAPTKISFQGEVDIMFLHADRVFAYAPAVEVDYTANTGGYTAGYDGVRTFKVMQHEHSESTEDKDIQSFAVGDAVYLVLVDPDDPTNVDFEKLDVSFVDSTNDALTVAVAPTIFDTTKRWRIIYAAYPYVQSSQHLCSFQAGTNKTITQTSVADVYGSYAYPPDATTQASDYDDTRAAELQPLTSYQTFGPNAGNARDCAYDMETSLLIDSLMDHHTRRSSPTYATGASTNSLNDGWQLLRVEPIFLGDLLYAGDVNRYLWVAPHWRNTGSSTEPVVYLRIWLSGYPPTGTSNVNLPNATPGYTIKAPAAGNVWGINAEDTAWRTDQAQAYPLGNLNGHQYGFLIVEGTRRASIRGLAQVGEGPRVYL